MKLRGCKLKGKKLITCDSVIKIIISRENIIMD